MKIYTKQGDKGTTAIYTHTVMRVDKDDILLDCYGTLDELNSYLGLIASLLANEELPKWHKAIQASQNNIFSIGFALSDSDKLAKTSIDELEQYIDALQQLLAPQTSFILPGGHLIASHLHVARTLARRAERQLVSVSKQHSVNDLALAYINRLSDFLFVLARYLNHCNNIPDISV